nr:hypothetical protein [Tanacetum cinerariifolium]
MPPRADLSYDGLDDSVFKSKTTGPKKNRPVWDNTARVNHQNKLTHLHPKRKFIPVAVLTKSGLVPVNGTKQSSYRAASSASAARHVNTVAPKPYSLVRRQNKDFSGIVTPIFATMLVPPVVEGEGSGQPSEPQPPSLTAPPEQDDRVVRAATTATSLEADQESGNINKTRSTTTLRELSRQGTGSGSGPRCQDTTLRDAAAQTRFETASKKSHDPPLSEVNTSRRSKKKKASSKLNLKSPKKVKVIKEQESAVDEQEKEEFRLCLKIVQDEVWRNQQEWSVIRWNLYEYFGVHTLLLDDTLVSINMMVDKKYPLTKEMLEIILNLRLEADLESTMAFELIRFIKAHLEE